MQTLKQKQINMRRFACLALLMVLSWAFSARTFAQEITVSGTVSDNNGAALQGATVRSLANKSVTRTDANGKFSLKAPQGSSLRITYVGFADKTVTVNGSSISIQLSASTDELDDVVVVAMDMKKSARSLTYSAQTVDGETIKESQRENFINGLQGRVAGLTLTTTSGLAGASSSIVLRGFNSLSMSNQPLFVIDGIVISNETMDEDSRGGTATGIPDRTGLTGNQNKNSDYNNRISDINPNDIESVTVLKGPEATALYGSQASSGAIIITTKKAKSNKLAVQYDNSFRIQSITRFQDVLQGYGNGSNGESDNVFRYFGPKLPAGATIYDNKKDFFKTGFSHNHNLGADFGIGESKFRFSATYFDQSGVIPTNNYKKINLRLSNTTKITKWLSVTPTVSYINTRNNKVLRSAGGFMNSLFLYPDTLSIKNSGDAGTKIPLFNAANPNGEFDNPLFNVNNNKAADETNRFIGTLGVDLNPTSWLALQGRFGYETFSTDGYTRYHPLSYYIANSVGGLQDNYYRKYTGYNHTINATAKKKVNDFEFRLMVGTMWQDYETQMFSMTGTGLVDSIRNGVMYKNGQVVTQQNYEQLLGSYKDSTVTNPATRVRLLRNVFGLPNLSQTRMFAYFGEAAISWRNMIFFNYSHRFEEASTLPKKNRRYNYPGGGISIIMSDLIPGFKNRILNYWKVRSSMAATARLNSPYSTQSVFVNNLTGGGGFSYGFTNNNAELGPERQKTFEIGSEMGLFNSKINLNFTYYNTLNTDQIIEGFRLSYGTGYVLNTQNAGSTRNQGIEISLGADIVKKSNFSWRTMLNFNKMWNEVLELPKNITEFYLADTWIYGNARGGLFQGGPTTTITAAGYVRNNKGQVVINPNTGLPVIDPLFKVRGDRNPNFTLGWNNSFKYKNWSLNMLWDFKVGGDIFNGQEHYLTTVGRSRLTADRETPRVIEGVLQDGLENTATPTQNTIVVTPATNDLYYRNMPEGEFIQKDVNWARLRDLTISYTFGESMMKRLKKIKGLSVFVTANDLILWTNYYGPDPNINATTSGTRGVGAFGFDFGTLPAPISLNFGFRTNF